MDEDENWRAEMYASNDEDEVIDELSDSDPLWTPPKDSVQAQIGAMNVAMTVNSQKVVVPTMALVQAQKNTLDMQARQIRQLLSAVRQLRQMVNSHTNEIARLDRELDKKFDAKDFH